MVEAYSWNPERRRYDGRIGRRIPIRRCVNNFGDLLGPMIVDRLLRLRGIDPLSGEGRLLSVGSVIHLAESGDTLWGSGVNGKTLQKGLRTQDLDVRAVRGPQTLAYLTERGIHAPSVFGDPALLLPELMPDLKRWADEPKRHKVSVVPNFNDIQHYSARWFTRRNHVDPRRPVLKVLERIARSELVVASSLHAIIVAESLHIPARAFRPSSEPEFKYLDYYQGTGRSDCEMAFDSSYAVELGGRPTPTWDPKPLLAAFPYDLWGEPRV